MGDFLSGGYMEWFLVISMLGSDELLVKQMPSKTECVKMVQDFKKKTSGKVRGIDSIRCEQGQIMESYDAGAKSEEVY